MEEFCRCICLELEIEFSSGACGRASFQKQRCPPWLASGWGINACERPGCLSLRNREKRAQRGRNSPALPPNPTPGPAPWGKLGGLAGRGVVVGADCDEPCCCCYFQRNWFPRGNLAAVLQLISLAEGSKPKCCLRATMKTLDFSLSLLPYAWILRHVNLKIRLILYKSY